MARTCIVTLTTRIPELKANVQRLAEMVVERTAQQAVAIAKESMAEPKSGRLYQRGKVVHQASAPGEAPAIDTGHLVNSFFIRKLNRLQRLITVGAEYAVHLEFGTSRMAARPFLRPALKKVAPHFRMAMAEIIRRGAE